MSLSHSSLPPGFSWLRATYRPSDREVDTFAHLIANAEGYPGEASAERLLDEAELQLWAWRTTIRKRPSRPRRNPPQDQTSAA
jgi:hypothetical protein